MSLFPLLYLLFLSSGVLLLAFAITALFPWLSAARRLLVWQASFAAIAACSPLAFLDIRIPLPILPADSAATAPIASAPSSALPRDRDEGPAVAPVDLPMSAALEVKSLSAPSSPSLNWAIVAWSVWALGVSVALLRSGIGFLILRGVRRRSVFIGRADGGFLTHDAKSGIPVYSSEEIGTPMVVGFLAPAIIVPESLVSEAGRSLHAVLLHESSHAKRGDVFFLALAGMLSAIHWFNPLVWLAVARLRADSERAADDDALSGAISPTEYAEILLCAARRLKSTDSRLFPVSRMAEDSKLGSRLSHLLDMSADRSAPTANGRRLAIFGVVIIAAVILTVRPVTASSPETPASGEVSPANPNRKLPEDLKTASVIVADEAGNPVSGARIVLEGLRSSVDPGS
ncbi:MAG TPA: M56 family metallopeptidase, partial [Fimbriimonadaceae bacterium]|nr:M56 family metallopeptidase [Fimbriimonadaceae bacterium]